METKSLDKNDVVPLYVQLHRIIKELILKGEYKEGDLLPSETTMMNTFNTTRGTVRKAISELVKEGLVYQNQGKGTFVCIRQVKYSIWNFSGFTDYLKTKNETPVSKVLAQENVTIDGKDYFKLVRARGVKKDGQVLFLTIDTSLLPISLFPSIEKYNFATDSLYRIMREEYNIYPRHSEITLSPVMIDDRTREILRVKSENSILMKAEGKVLNEENTEIEKVSVIYGDNIEIKIMTNIN
ncbi:GntR family transcriptional regulator [Neobacillus sp. OS1-32]|uniref:GntR family transcriptional regulator n=1 Tax=Neobacillus paridis TaxID=2803862 RepID=A0ABS1TQ12_9BACI|nr:MULTISPECIES: GntR family transcriptional regulator [Neobacillus]MBL4953268.1 GntR family transcriptional regulator [Neobacillus paridis]WML29648.1 GntR family transcriptional regulator [Neobacillus sp. OS1-32]